jgi:hypothetical protein
VRQQRGVEGRDAELLPHVGRAEVRERDVRDEERADVGVDPGNARPCRRL